MFVQFDQEGRRAMKIHQFHLISNRLEGKVNDDYVCTKQLDQEGRRAMKIHRLYLISNRFKGKYNGKKGETIILTQHCDVRKLPSK